jgi:hypothetical protein
MKKSKTPPDPITVAIESDYPNRLAELEQELRRAVSGNQENAALKKLVSRTSAEIASVKVIQFKIGQRRYATGHSDVTYSGSNHARGVRHIYFYESDQQVFDIEGEFEDQQLGSNFRFRNVIKFVPGEWEADFVKVTDDLRFQTEKRRLAFRKKREARPAGLSFPSE